MDTQTQEVSLRQLTENIAKALGPEWKRSTKFDADDAADVRPWRARIEGPDQQALFLSNTWGPKGMLHVSGWPPDYIDRNRVSVPTSESINVSLKKTPEQMARDIERRLLPVYRIQLAETLIKYAAAEEWKAGVEETKARVAQILGAVTKKDSDIVYGHGKVDVQVSAPDSLRLVGHCLYMTADQLARFQKALPELFERESTEEVRD